jgi:multidrug efflux pump subunit AcrA (membrane-fusion protein)
VFNAPDGVNLEAFLGDKVTLTPVDQPDLSLSGTITEVSPLVDANTGSVILKARVDSAVPEGVVFGTPVIGRLTLPQVPAIILPWTALTSLASGPAVWTVEPAAMTVAQVPVTVSAYGGDTVQLSGGIAPGTMVVTDGSQLLYPGRVVAPMKAGN